MEVAGHSEDEQRREEGREGEGEVMVVEMTSSFTKLILQFFLKMFNTLFGFC